MIIPFLQRVYPMSLRLLIPLLIVCLLIAYFFISLNKPFESRLRYPLKLNDQHESLMTLSDRMSYHHVPGVSIAIIDKGKIIIAKGYGLKDATTKEPVDTDTLFQACSLSKMVTAVGVLLLVQEGKVKLDEDINVYLKRWSVPKHPLYKNAPLTIRQLLTHTGGVTVSGIQGYPAGEQIPDLIDFLKGKKPLSKNDPVEVAWKPGKKFRYSGGGTTILELMIEDVTGMPFKDFIQKAIFNPLKMNRSFFEPPLAKTESNFATGHNTQGRPISGKYYNLPSLSAAGLWTTPTDFAKLGLTIQQSLIGKGLLRPEMAELMTASVIPACGEFVALGAFISIDGKTFVHSGSNPGMKCKATFLKEGQKGIVIMTNGENGENLEVELRHSIYTTYRWPMHPCSPKSVVTLDPSTLHAYAGDYWTILNRGTRNEKTIQSCKITVLNDRLGIQWIWYPTSDWKEPEIRPVIEAFPLSSTHFVTCYGEDIYFKNDCQFTARGQVCFKK
jgi:CubicO group peptidase (beta-lactamase class C family)